MKRTLRKGFYKYRFLAITAAGLFILSLLFSITWSARQSPAAVRERFEQYLEEGETAFDLFASDTSALLQIVKGASVPGKAYQYTGQETFLFVYTENDIGNLLLSFWNTNKAIPQPSDLKLPDGKHLVTYSSGTFQFIKVTRVLNAQVVIVTGLVPIQWKYFIQNSYLVPDFPALSHGDDRYEINTENPHIRITNGDGRYLFGLSEIDKITTAIPGEWVVVLKVLAILLLLAYLHMVAYMVAQRHGWKRGFLFLAGAVLLLRLISYIVPFPFAYRKLALFDPAIYASNAVHPSLGDLLVNMVLVFWLVSFLRYMARPHLQHAAGYTGRKAWNITVLIGVLLLGTCLTAANIVRSLIIDSQISFDVANFFKLNEYTLISFFILCFVALSFHYICQLLLLQAIKCKGVPVYGKYLAVTIAGLLFFTVNLERLPIAVNIAVLAWLLVFTYIVERRKSDMFIPLMRSSFFLLWLVLFSASISALLLVQRQKQELEERKKTAEKLADRASPSTESIVRVGISNFGSFLKPSNFLRFYYERENRQIKDSLIKENFSGYINKYDTRIYTFDSTTNPLYNEDTVLYETVLNYIENQSKRAATPDVYYHENSFERYSYFYFREVRNEDSTLLGYFFVMADPKKYKRETLYPELLKQDKDIVEDEMGSIYAIYNKGQIIMHSGEYNFVSHIRRSDYPKGVFEERKKKSFSELWHSGINNTIVVVVKSSSFTYEAVTLFAYLFGTILLVVVLLHTIAFFVRSRFRWSRVKSNLRLNIRNQIQATIIFISVFSFVVIAAATIGFYIIRFEKNNRQRLVRSVEIMSNELKHLVATQVVTDQSISLWEPGARTVLEQSVNDIAEIHGIDVNLFNLSGELKLSTQPYIYRKQVVSSMMDPHAYFAIHYKQQIQLIQKEAVANISYTSIYAPVRDLQGRPYAYINIPYLGSEAELDQEISNFLVTLINLNAFIFVFAGAIAFLVTNRITRSFTLISSKMKEVNLRKANEEIQWNTNDEIGELVNEYNKMVRKLDESAQALAKTEREGAWREMARQVAHEIKNPLTPMKLSIQYLQRSIRDKSPDLEQLSKRVADTLVEQIDQLAKIASDFSQFAHIGNVKLETFDAHDVLGSLVNLYSTGERISLRWSRHPSQVMIHADRNQVNRLFTNLLQNAVEASSANDKINIIIEEKLAGNNWQVAIADNGQGIPEEKQDKIFTPNFTTKTSGTGLGLAICKGIVEKANGRIWFETEEGKGTTFYVVLPVVVG